MGRGAQQRVLIVGAGPTGMTAAIESQRCGLRTRIIDRADGLARWSQALVVQARTLEQFQRYGIAEEVIARGRKLSGGSLWSEGKRIAHLHFEHIPSRFPFVLFLPQRDTEQVLNAHMESLGVCTERRTELLSLEQDAGGVRARLRLPGGEEEIAEADWLIGCDGAHSTVRHQLGIPFEGKALELRFILGDLALRGPDTPTDEVEVHFRGGNLVFLARLDERLTRVFIGSHVAPGEKTEADAKAELTVEQFQQALDRNGIRVQVTGADWTTPFSVNDRQAVRYRDGRVFLAGDASHIHSPVGGQGMNTGIQDAANLLWKIAASARGAEPSLLESYGQERGEVGRHLLAFTERILGMGTSTHRWVEVLRDNLLPWVTAWTPVQAKAAGFLSETAIHYRSSAVVEDEGGSGRLRAGDRMPDISVGTGSLLTDWTEAKPMLVAVGLPPGKFAALQPGVVVREVDPAELDAEGREQLGSGPTSMLVRPDGYIGYRGPAEPGEQGTDAGWKLATALRQLGVRR